MILERFWPRWLKATALCWRAPYLIFVDSIKSQVALKQQSALVFLRVKFYPQGPACNQSHVFNGMDGGLGILNLLTITLQSYLAEIVLRSDDL